jgi:hypothetical protein
MLCHRNHHNCVVRGQSDGRICVHVVPFVPFVQLSIDSPKHLKKQLRLELIWILWVPVINRMQFARFREKLWSHSQCLLFSHQIINKLRKSCTMLFTGHEIVHWVCTPSWRQLSKNSRFSIKFASFHSQPVKIRSVVIYSFKIVEMNELMFSLFGTLKHKKLVTSALHTSCRWMKAQRYFRREWCRLHGTQTRVK